MNRLEVAWTYDSHDAFKGSEMQSNPIIVDGVLYATTPKLRVVALNAETGREIWSFDPNPPDAMQRRYRHRGVTVYKDRFSSPTATICGRSIGSPASPFKVSATAAGLIFGSGLTGRRNRSPSAPAVQVSCLRTFFIIGSTVPETLPGSPGHIRAFDVNTGKLRWIFHTIPHPGEFGYETWSKDSYKISGGANAWAGLSLDPKLGMVFAATGQASFDFYGANRIGDNLFADCVLALDARTGRRIWHFQGIRHDVWDLDFPAAPSLVTVTRKGRKVEAVAQISKTGYVFVLDRRTGESLFPIENRPVPPSTLDGEKLSPTQPYPLKPPPFTRQTFTKEMVTDRTPEAHAAVLAKLGEPRFKWHVHTAEPSRHRPFPRHGWGRRVGWCGL